MAKVHVHSLGCRLNQAEAEKMAQGFVLAGHEVVDCPDSADIRVVNTCTVTKAAGDKSKKAARPLRPDQRLVITGCHSQVAPDAFGQADLIVANEVKEELVALTLERFGMDGLALGADYQKHGQLDLYPLVLNHTRAFVKIQDGCNMRCTFCLTTVARGMARSRPQTEIVDEINGLAEKGCQEVVLTGVHAGSYGIDGGPNLAELLEILLKETAVPRIRLSSLEPWNFEADWVDLWERHGDRLCRHLHMSLQSGCDSVLRRMARCYRASNFEQRIQHIRKHVPGMAITTDIIVGFPAKPNLSIKRVWILYKHLTFADAHLFTYSPRPQTARCVTS